MAACMGDVHDGVEVVHVDGIWRNDLCSKYSWMKSVGMLVVIIKFSFYMVVVSENGELCKVLITFD